MQNLRNNILSQVDKLLEQSKGPVFAAFDADGTLWKDDAGEGFFKYQIQNCNLKLPPEPWDYYHTWKLKDPPGAYLWLAQINQGKSIEEVRSWADDFQRSNKSWHYFELQQSIIEEFLKRRIRTFVVTASIKWSVEPWARTLGLSNDDVLGVKTEVVNGIVGNKQDGPITWRQGKSVALLEATNGIQPIFCSGNTMGDFQLLESSSFLRLAVSSAKEGSELYSTEQELAAKAKVAGWLTHQF